jgi:hypothetical protein
VQALDVAELTVIVFGFAIGVPVHVVLDDHEFIVTVVPLYDNLLDVLPML